MLSERVRPKQISLMIGNEEARLQLMRWLKNWKIGSKAILLIGPPGVGKSTSIHAAASELRYRVLEYNASDFRTRTKLSEALGGALENASLFGEKDKMLVFLDEVDGISGRADYAGIDFILEFIENATMPVAMASNSEDDSKLRKLIQKSLVVHFSPVSQDLIFVFLKSIAKREAIHVSEESLRQISTGSKGDVRYALNMLQTIVASSPLAVQTDKQFFSDASALDAIFGAVSFEKAIQNLRQFDAPPMDKVRAVFDSVVSSKTISDKERADSLKMLSAADILVQEMSKNQRWRLLRYLDRYLALATYSKNLKRSDSSIPWNLRVSIWNDGRKVKGFLADLSDDFHVGKNAFAVSYLPYFSFYFRNRPNEFKQFLSLHHYGDPERRVILKMATRI
jgi:replication factor C large subunit